VQFWTSRGFAVLDVDYGGSTGYGKAYRQSLLGNWGLLDVDDVKHAALYCVLQKKANANWICIDGRSAGGYTTLAALTFTNTFRAGASLYGIGDLSLLADETHKFESRYLEGLIGPYPEAKEMFDARCPILHLDQLTCPAILLQGDEDKVVPPSQAETMYAAHRKKGLPSTLILYKGEQHGFRQSNHISHALLSEYSFFCQTFGFELQQEGDFKGIKIGERVEIE
jgi:dipeptidyl aminopeptidase/acylaminoacyl peptidase